jgi:transcriptional regulator with XRE-family HTH domain
MTAANTPATRLRCLRKTLGLTQEQFAEKVGFSRPALANIELGNSSLTEANIRLICLTFGVRDAWLREGEGEMWESGWGPQGKQPAPEEPVIILDDDGNPLKLDADQQQVVEICQELWPDNREDWFAFGKHLLKEQGLESENTVLKAEAARPKTVDFALTTDQPARSSHSTGE